MAVNLLIEAAIGLLPNCAALGPDLLTQHATTLGSQRHLSKSKKTILRIKDSIKRLRHKNGTALAAWQLSYPLPKDKPRALFRQWNLFRNHY